MFYFNYIKLSLAGTISRNEIIKKDSHLYNN